MPSKPCRITAACIRGRIKCPRHNQILPQGNPHLAASSSATHPNYATSNPTTPNSYRIPRNLPAVIATYQLLMAPRKPGQPTSAMPLPSIRTPPNPLKRPHLSHESTLPHLLNTNTVKSSLPQPSFQSAHSASSSSVNSVNQRAVPLLNTQTIEIYLSRTKFADITPPQCSLIPHRVCP